MTDQTEVLKARLADAQAQIAYLQGLVNTLLGNHVIKPESFKTYGDSLATVISASRLKAAVAGSGIEDPVPISSGDRAKVYAINNVFRNTRFEWLTPRILSEPKQIAGFIVSNFLEMYNPLAIPQFTFGSSGGTKPRRVYWYNGKEWVVDHGKTEFRNRIILPFISHLKKLKESSSSAKSLESLIPIKMRSKNMICEGDVSKAITWLNDISGHDCIVAASSGNKQSASLINQIVTGRVVTYECIKSVQVDFYEPTTQEEIPPIITPGKDSESESNELSKYFVGNLTALQLSKCISNLTGLDRQQALGCLKTLDAKMYREIIEDQPQEVDVEGVYSQPLTPLAQTQIYDLLDQQRTETEPSRVITSEVDQDGCVLFTPDQVGAIFNLD